MCITVCFLIFFVFIEISNGLTIDDSFIEEKLYCQATIDDNFANDRVLIALNKSTTRKYKKKTFLDFEEIGCINVEEITESTCNIVKQQIDARNTGNWSSIIDRQNNNMLVDEETFRTLLCLKLNTNSKENVLNVIKLLEQRDDVLLANPDYYMEFFSIPNPLPLHYNSQWAISKISLPEAWDLTVGSSDVVVGVMDSGIQGDHLDLTDRLLYNLCADFRTGSVLTPNPIDTEPGGHGTLVAGIIGAQRNNGTPYVTGVAQNIRLASLLINDLDTASSNSGLTLSISSIQRAINFATTNQIPIINCSTGYRSYSSFATTTHKSTLQTAIEGYPGLFIAAAGNEGDNNYNNNNGNNDINPIYPASFNLPRLISVGASTQSDDKLYESCYGLSTVDLFAPGDGIYTTCISVKVTSSSGTSAATPHVSGVAALMLSANPTLTPEQIKQIIIDSVTLIPSFNSICVSGGRLNAFEAVKMAMFNVDNSGVLTIKPGTILPTDLIIPSVVNNKNVVTISNTLTGLDLKSVTIPSTITNTNDNIFHSNTLVKWVDNFEFKSNKITSFLSTQSNYVIPSFITSIDNNVFASKSGLIDLTIPATVTSLNSNTFHSNTQVKWNSNYTFKNNTFIEYLGNASSFTIPSSIAGKTISTIGNNAFSSKSGLLSVTLLNDVTSIGSNAFHANTTVTWNSNFVYKNNEITNFLSTSSSYTIPSFINSIDNDVFINTSGLLYLTIPSNVSSLDNTNFHANTAVTWSDNFIFKNNKLTSFIKNTGNYGIPSFITSIGSYAFDGKTGLNTIIFTASVISIEDYAFNNCTGLVNIHSLSYYPVTINNTTFNNVNRANITLVVAYSKINAYILAGWTDFGTYGYTPCTTHSYYYTPIYLPTGESLSHNIYCYNCPYSSVGLHKKVNGSVTCCYIIAPKSGGSINIHNCEVHDNILINYNMLYLPWKEKCLYSKINKREIVK